MPKPSCEAPPLWLDSNNIWSESTVICTLEEKELIFLAFYVLCPWNSQSGSPGLLITWHHLTECSLVIPSESLVTTD